MAAAPKALIIPAAGVVDPRYVVVGLLETKRVGDGFFVAPMWKSQREICFKCARMM